MASTYVNNLRLNEMATGDGSGTWGTTTNTNLELIGQALGYGTRAIANASTDNITIADGASDSDRAMYLKLTGGGQACTVTLLPNTASKVWMMENATSYTLAFTCGSGANVSILAGETKIIATDGGGSGGIVYDVLTDTNLAGTTKTAALTNAGALSNQGTVTVGVDDTGYDVKLFGATSGKYMLWDESADSLIVTGSTSQQGTLTVGVDDTGYDVKLFGATSGKYWLWDESADGVLQYSTLTVGVDDTGYDVKFFGATSGAYMLWDESADDLKLVGAAGFTVAGDIDIDGTANLDVVDIDGATQADGTITVGVDDTGYDVKFFGATSGAYMLWDESADDLVLAGAAGLDIAGDVDVDGTTNLDVVDIDGAVDMASSLTMSGGSGGDIIIVDNGKVEIGSASGGDLQLYHDATDSYVNNQGSGHLKIRGNDVRIEDSSSGHSMGLFIEDGGVELYHNNVKKFETVTGGIDVTGTVTQSTAKTKYFTGQYDGREETTITLGSLGFKPQVLFCIFNVGTSQHASWGMSARDGGQQALLDYDVQASGDGYESTATYFGRLAFGGAVFSNLIVSSWNADDVVIQKVIQTGSSSTVVYRITVMG